MSKQNQKTDQNHQRFIQDVCQQGKIWTLKSPDVYAISSSINYTNDEGEPLPMLCAWSSKELALACAKQEWEVFEAESIELGSFLEDWCIGMDEDGLMVGTNFTSKMEGTETEPLLLILELTTELKRAQKKIQLQHFSGVTDLIEQIREVLEFRG